MLAPDLHWSETISTLLTTKVLFWSLLAFPELLVEAEDPAFEPMLPDAVEEPAFEEPVFEAMLPDVVSELEPLGLALALLAPLSQRPCSFTSWPTWAERS